MVISIETLRQFVYSLILVYRLYLPNPSPKIWDSMDRELAASAFYALTQRKETELSVNLKSLLDPSGQTHLSMEQE